MHNCQWRIIVALHFYVFDISMSYELVMNQSRVFRGFVRVDFGISEISGYQPTSHSIALKPYESTCYDMEKNLKKKIFEQFSKIGIY